MTKRIATLLLLLTLVPAALVAQSFSAILSGANEVPAGDPDGSGLAVVTITGTTIRYTIFVDKIAAPTAAHIHSGAAGTAGGVVVGLNGTFIGGGLNGEVAGVSQSVIDQIVANPNGFYVNVHNGEFADGAVRGQLSAANGGEGARSLYLPIVGKVSGAAGTNFVTDVRIINRTGSTANVTLDYFQRSASGQSAPTATKNIAIAPGEQKVLDDVIGFLGAADLGGLRIGSDQDVEVLARVINDLRGSNQGTTGFLVEASELGEAKTSGTIGFLSQASGADIATGVGFRTNLGYFNPTAAPVNVTLTARRSADGAPVGTKTVSVPGYGMLQQGAFQMIDTVSAADQIQPNFYVTWTASAPLFVYGSVVDNKSGDPVLIR